MHKLRATKNNDNKNIGKFVNKYVFILLSDVFEQQFGSKNVVVSQHRRQFYTQ